MLGIRKEISRRSDLSKVFVGVGLKPDSSILNVG
jgi:hypothetical protein